ncbi:nucleoside deaminase [Paenibacillus woosongensis]|uniref:Nucleoside deaminase n=1 Tax=Paenibacillus woosongensis TaxID=307580 RepID=A0AA95L336_9BACL|nr:nucleoside deaminase [Paenibacillus woosongensis]WHX50817.1 nucleoside deaminase [Paenibacillus woosongensis]
MNTQQFLQLAIDLARSNVKEKGGRPFGAVIVRNGEVVATGVNTVLKTKDPTDHAEMRAIREASRVLGSELLSDCEIYASGEPCPMCQGAIQRADLKAVYYATPKEVAMEAKVVPAGSNPNIPFQYVEMANGSEPFELWTKRKENTE